MTYCCGILVRDGVVRVADMGANAGLDNIATFRKLHISPRIDAGDDYLRDLRDSWSSALRAANRAIPAPPYRGRAS